jgi:rubrerythrin
MVFHNSIDPRGTDFDSPVYECAVCGGRHETGGVCPDCDVELQNTSVPRE